MTKIDSSGNIEHTRGDTFTIEVTPLISSETGDVYYLGEGEYAQLSLRLFPDSEPIITKTASSQDENGVCLFSFTAEEADLPRTSYIYDIKLFSADGSAVCTFIGGGNPSLKFRIV